MASKDYRIMVQLVLDEKGHYTWVEVPITIGSEIWWEEVERKQSRSHNEKR